MNVSLLVAGEVLYRPVVNSSTHCYSIVELAMEPYTRTENDGREDHDVDALNGRSSFGLSILAGVVIPAIDLLHRCPDL
jgi:hypothetical protein